MSVTNSSVKASEIKIAFNVEVWKEGQTHVAYAPDLDVSSCGRTASQAKSRLREAVLLFIEEAIHQGTLRDILAEAGFERHGQLYRPRPVLAREKMRLTVPAA